MKWRDKLKINNLDDSSSKPEEYHYSDDRNDITPMDVKPSIKKNQNDYNFFSKNSEVECEQEPSFEELYTRIPNKKDSDEVIPMNDGEISTKHQELINEIYQSRHYKKAIFEKDIVAFSLCTLAFLGIIGLITPGQVPAVGKSFFMGLDIDLWWWFFKGVTFLTGSMTAISLMWKLRGHSVVLDKIFKFLPSSGKFALRYVSLLFFCSLLFTNIIQIINHDIFKNPSEWKVLEFQQLDSRDPAKRAQFAGIIKPLNNPPAIVTSPPLDALPQLPVPVIIPNRMPSDSSTYNLNKSQITDDEIADQMQKHKSVAQNLQLQGQTFEIEMLKAKLEQERLINEINKVKK